MRRRLLLRSLVLAGAAFFVIVAGSVASITLLGNRTVLEGVQGRGTSASKAHSANGIASALAIDASAGQLAAQEGIAASAPAPALAAVQPAGPSVFEQQARQQQPSGQISAGPSTFEQQLRSQVPRPGPIPPITRGASPHWP